MPQSSLTAWLSKPAVAPKKPAVDNAPPRGPSAFEDKQDDLASSAKKQESISPRSQDLTLASAATQPLPPNVQLRSCTKDDIKALKRLNSLLLPVPYPESFYREIIEDALTNNITLLAFWHDRPSDTNEKGRLVGAIRCRIFGRSLSQDSTPAVQSGSKRKGPMLYLSTLVLLSPYRSHGIATHLLRTILRRAADAYGIVSVGAHVWESNAEGLAWYRKRGFREVGREEGYYRKLQPNGNAVVMQRELSVLDFSA